MELANVKIGQKVRVVGTMGFYTHYHGKEGVVFKIEGASVSVRFEDGDDDYGYACDLELLPEPSLVKEITTVKEAIANVESALEALKVLVG